MSDTAKTTLHETEISSTSGGFGRRAFLLGTFGGGTLLAGCVPTTTTVVRVSGITDSDSGAYADPAGNGRGRRTGLTDSDGGAYADPAGNGRGRRACTDSDLGAYSDPVGRGRRC